MRKSIPVLLLLSFAFATCKNAGADLKLSDKEKAHILSERAHDLFYGPDGRVNISPDSIPNITKVLEIVDSAISYDPGNVLYYYQKSGYLQTTYQEESLKKILREILLLDEDQLPATEALGKSFARTGETDSAKRYFGKAIELWRKQRTPGLAPAFVDSAYVAHFEYYITGDKAAALRKIRDRADTSRLTEREKTRLGQILEDFDLDQSWIDQ